MRFLLKYIKVFLLLLAWLITWRAFANPHQVTLQRFVLESGDTLSPVSVSYSLFGKFNADSSNTILICTWFTGKSPEVGRLWTAETGFIDTARFSVIVIDAPGNGLSTSPSNYKSVLFPEISIADMVRMQHDAISTYLGIRKVYAVVGISMGGMQAWQWVALYPQFMQKMVAISATPVQSTYDQLFWNTTLNLLQLSLNKTPELSDSLLKTVAMLQELHLYTPGYQNAAKMAEEAVGWIQNTITYSKDANPQNWICQVKAMLRHNVFRYRAKQLWKKNELPEVLLISSKHDLMVNGESTAAASKMLGPKMVILNDSCGHQSSVLCGKHLIKKEIDMFL